MLHRYFRIADAGTLEAGRFDQSAGGIVWRVLEHTTRARHRERLRVTSIVEVVLDYSLDLRSDPLLQLKPHPDNDAAWQQGPSILEPHLRCFHVHDLAFHVHHANSLDRILHLSELCPGVHHHTAGHSPRNSRRPFQSRKGVADGVPDQGRHSDSPLRIENGPTCFFDRPQPHQADHDPAYTPISDEQIRPTQYEQGNLACARLPDHKTDILNISRFNHDICWPSDLE